MVVMDREMSGGTRQTLGARVHGTASSFRFVTMGAGLLLLGFAIFMFFGMIDQHTPTRTALLTSAGIAAIGLMVFSYSYRYKREWIAVDDEGISKPWAFSRVRLLWKDLMAIRPQKHLELAIQDKLGRELVVKRSLPGHNDLVDRICFELDRVRGPVQRRAWLTAGNGFSIEAEDLVLEKAGQKHRVPFKRVRRVVFDVDGRSNAVLQLVLANGNTLSLPSVDPSLSFDALRAISFAVHQVNPPTLSSEQREQDSAIERGVERRVEYQMLRRILISVAVLIAIRSVGRCGSPSRR